VVENNLEVFYGSNRISFGVLRGISNLIRRCMPAEKPISNH